ncbi:hypothetical protein [Novacetimonas hansenii]|nr:hypothetical protein [Novacetimonas hansenii]
MAAGNRACAPARRLDARRRENVTHDPACGMPGTQAKGQAKGQAQ